MKSDPPPGARRQSAGMSYPSFEEYTDTLRSPPGAVFSDPVLARGTVRKSVSGIPFARSGNFALTYEVSSGGSRYAVRCFHKEADSLERRYGAIARKLRSVANPYFVEFDFQPAGIRTESGQYPIVRMKWADGRTLAQFVSDHRDDPETLLMLRESLRDLAQLLEDNDIAHGDIQPGNVIVRSATELALIDYDGMFVPELEPWGSTELGQRNFQHPGRSWIHFDERLDRFSFAVLDVALEALALQPALWELTGSDEAGIVLRAADFADPSSSAAFGVLIGLDGPGARARELAAICRSPFERIPSLEDFRAGRRIPAAGTITFATSASPAKPAYIPAYSVLDATNFARCCAHIGDRVELVGRVCRVVRETAAGEEPPVVRVEFGEPQEDMVRLALWPADGVADLGCPTDLQPGQWLCAIGLVDPILTETNDGQSYKSVSIVITEQSQLRLLTEAEAMHRLAAEPSSTLARRDVAITIGTDPAVPGLLVRPTPQPLPAVATTDSTLTPAEATEPTEGSPFVHSPAVAEQHPAATVTSVERAAEPAPTVAPVESTPPTAVDIETLVETAPRPQPTPAPAETALGPPAPAPVETASLPARTIAPVTAPTPATAPRPAADVAPAVRPPLPPASSAPVTAVPRPAPGGAPAGTLRPARSTIGVNAPRPAGRPVPSAGVPTRVGASAPAADPFDDVLSTRPHVTQPTRRARRRIDWPLRWPSLDWLSIRLRALHWPSVSWPSTRLRTLHWPSVSWPSTRLRTLHWPSLKWPSLPWRSLHWPGLHGLHLRWPLTGGMSARWQKLRELVSSRTLQGALRGIRVPAGLQKQFRGMHPAWWLVAGLSVVVLLQSWVIARAPDLAAPVTGRAEPAQVPAPNEGAIVRSSDAPAIAAGEPARPVAAAPRPVPALASLQMKPGTARAPARPRLLAHEDLRAAARPIATIAGPINVVTRTGTPPSSVVTVSGTPLADSRAEINVLAHRSVFSDREVIVGFSDCTSASPACDRKEPFWLLLRKGSPPVFKRSPGLRANHGAGQVTSAASGVHVDLGLWDGVRQSATLTSLDGIYITRVLEAPTPLGREACRIVSATLESCAASRDCSSFDAITRSAPPANMATVRRLFHESTGLNAAMFRSVCVRSCELGMTPTSELVRREVCGGAEPGQWIRTSLGEA
jgi:hypothetical protein